MSEKWYNNYRLNGGIKCMTTIVKKKRSKILLDLIRNDITVIQALQSLDLMTEDLGDNEIRAWINKELNGYNNDDAIPNYRKIDVTVVGDIQVGYQLYKNIQIPFPKKINDIIGTFDATEPISKIEQYSKAESDTESHCLNLEADCVLLNQYKSTNGIILSASRRLSIYSYTNILGSIKTKLISIFKELEKNYGNLDDLYIEFSDPQKEKDVTEKIINIIFLDNSTTIGNNNSMENSIVGDNNEN